MKVQFKGPEAEVTVFGKTFTFGKPTDVSDLSDAHQAKLAANPTFDEAKGRGKAVADEPEAE